MKKQFGRILVLVIGLALMAVGFSAVAAAEAGRAHRRQKAETYGALCDAVGNLEAMAGDLSLAVVENEPLPALVSLRHHADLASAALDRLPLTGEGGKALRRFTAACGEAAGAMADGLARGSFRTPDYGLLIRLRDCAVKLAGEILPAAVSLREGRVDDRMLEDCFAGLGQLYYDGAASDVWVPGGYVLLQKGSQLDRTEALAAAERVLPGAHLTLVPGECGGDRFRFVAGNVSMSLSAVEGKLLSLICDRQILVEGEEIGAGEALSAAESALAEYIGTPMELIGSEVGEGCYYFSFAPRCDGVLCLSEKITVGIDGAVGKLCLWDAEGYYRYRTPWRVWPVGLLSPEDIADRFGGKMAVTLCTAVRADGREVYCYRLGEGESARYLNALNGRPEEIWQMAARSENLHIWV